MAVREEISILVVLTAALGIIRSRRAAFCADAAGSASAISGTPESRLVKTVLSLDRRVPIGQEKVLSPVYVAIGGQVLAIFMGGQAVAIDGVVF